MDKWNNFWITFSWRTYASFIDSSTKNSFSTTTLELAPVLYEKRLTAVERLIHVLFSRCFTFPRLYFMTYFLLFYVLGNGLLWQDSLHVKQDTWTMIYQFKVTSKRTCFFPWWSLCHGREIVDSIPYIHWVITPNCDFFNQLMKITNIAWSLWWSLNNS